MTLLAVRIGRVVVRVHFRRHKPIRLEKRKLLGHLVPPNTVNKHFFAEIGERAGLQRKLPLCCCNPPVEGNGGLFGGVN